ncbi:hypothetical protein [Phycicoccus flavus]|uniref:hypothetical protein n=1 Tax=Phycicoccus flavus TaxID=2502783 RepID=UPI000FEBBE0F|nr:hypothetical protein [Phycicoccus flavus]NHA70140.1 hypothetical protein [Phycicoccus flavus]
MTGPERDAPPLTTEEEDLLDRSARLLAAEHPEEFIDVSARVRSTVRATTRRSRPVHAVFPSDAQGGGPDTLVVREWVVVGALRRALAALPGITPTQIRLRLEADRCRGVEVHVTATYGAVLADAASAVRTATRSTLADVLGPEALFVDRDAAGVPVDVTVDDVTA